MLELELLGSPAIILDGKPVTELLSAKALLLVCYLATEQERSHDRDVLHNLLWSEVPEERARLSLRQALHHIQKTLPGYLIATRRTIAFDATRPHQVDVMTFCEILAETNVDTDQLEMAVSLYRGDFLEGYYANDSPTLEDWLGQKREYYQRLLLSALENLTDHFMLQDDWGHATVPVRRMLSIDPWHETSHQRLMLLLARQGEYNAALAQYETCRQILLNDLGIEPTSETTTLHERIQKARTARRHNLPAAPGMFIGRQAELDKLDKWIHDPHRRLITLVGPGGIGKTRLAQELVTHHLHRYLNGICYVSLGPVTQSEFIITAIAKAADIQIAGPASPRKQLFAQLAKLELLLLLDGFEHLVTDADLLRDILQAAPDIKIIVTSRENLDLQEEWVFTIDGLSIPPEQPQDHAPLEHFDAITCFVQNARRKRNDFGLKGQEDVVIHLCRILGGSPLGIELAAALVSVASCTQIVTEVEQNLDVLGTTQRKSPERYPSLRAVFNHSWQLLTHDEQLVFPRLSVFRGGFTLEAAREVAGTTLHNLNGLVAKSLLRATTEDNAGIRYQIHETLRQYAEEKLNGDPAVLLQMQAAHSAFFVGLLQQQSDLWTRGERQTTIAAMSRDLGNIRVAWQRVVDLRDIDAIEQAILPLRRLYDALSWFQEGSSLFAQAREALQPAASSEEQFVWGQLSIHCAAFHIFLGNAKEALNLVKQGIDILLQHEKDESLALALNVLGIAQLNVGNYDVAKEALGECLAIHRRLDNRRDLTAPLANLGMACIRTGDYVAARQVLEEGLAICREEDLHHGLAQFLNNLGSLHRTMGDLATAQRYFEQALPVIEDIERVHLKAIVMVHLGEIHVRQGAYDQALADCQAGIDLMRQISDLQSYAVGLGWQGLAYHGLGDEKSARRCLQVGLEIALKKQIAPVILGLLVGIAVLLLDSGRQEAGIDLLTTVAQHPATEYSDRTYAVELLAQQDITLREGAPYQEVRPLTEIASTFLVDLE
ncbi:MAG: tetratricopeptide repeat protein [Anaerolineae bacterium]|nr:tetratricopeptide repeat protein [Anaerolineae bacterium]